MLGRLYPIGYMMPFAFKHIQEVLAGDPHAYLIDIRYKAWSWKPEWRKEALEQEFKQRYRHWPSLGNINYNNDGPIKIVDPERGVVAIVKALGQGCSLILLCACQQYEQCHRRTVVELVQQQLPEVEVKL